MKPTFYVPILAVLLLISLYPAKNELITEPSDTVALLGQHKVKLLCRSSLTSRVIWHHKPYLFETFDQITNQNGDIMKKYLRKYSVEYKSNGLQQDLIIKNVTFEDGGQFKCFDNHGFAGSQEAVAELVVIGTLKGSHNIYVDESSTQTLSSRVLYLTCVLPINSNSSYIELVWKEKDGEIMPSAKSITFDHQNKEYQIRSSLMVNISTMNRSQFVCSIQMNKMFFFSSRNEPWISPVIRPESDSSTTSTEETEEADDVIHTGTTETKTPIIDYLIAIIAIAVTIAVAQGVAVVILWLRHICLRKKLMQCQFDVLRLGQDNNAMLKVRNEYQDRFEASTRIVISLQTLLSEIEEQLRAKTE